MTQPLLEVFAAVMRPTIVVKLTSVVIRNNPKVVTNVAKRKIIVDFRREVTPILRLVIDNSEVGIVDNFKLLHISSNLTWPVHVDYCVKKAQQRLFLLRRLKSFGLDADLLTRFHR